MENKRNNINIYNKKSLVILMFIVVFYIKNNIFSQNRVEQFINVGKYSNAVKEYDSLINTSYEKDVDKGELYYKSAELLLKYLLKPDESIKRLETIILRYPDSKYAERAWFLLSEAWIAKKDKNKAIEVLKKYIKSFNKKSINLEIKAFFEIANLMYSINNYKESLFWLKKITGLTNNQFFLKESLYMEAEIIWNIFKDREYSYNSILRYLSLTNLTYEERVKGKILLNRIRWQYIGRKEGLKDDCVSAIAFDKDDIWFGLWMGGIARYTRSRENIYIFTTQDGLISNYIRDIQIDENEIWVATFEGICRYDRAKAKWERFNQIPGVGSQRIKSVLVEPDTVWFATLGYGIYRLNRHTKIWDSFKNLALNIVKIRKSPYNGSIVFAALSSGVIILKPDGSFIKVFIPKTDVSDNYITVKDIDFYNEKILIATYTSGIFLCNLDGDNIKLLWQPKSYISTIRVKNNKLFVGTLGDGLLIKDLITGEEEKITVSDGLLSSSILTIEFEKDYIWLGTVDNGVNILYAPELLN